MDGSILPRAIGVRFCLVSRFSSPPPELHKTGTIQKYWNGATIYAETKCVLEQLSDIRVLECRLENCG